MKPAQPCIKEPAGYRGDTLATSQRKVPGILSFVSLIILGALIAIANCSSGVSASNEDPQLAQPGWRLAQPVTYDSLTIFPVLAASDVNTSEFATLDEALASGEALVTEQGSYLRRTRDGSIAPSFTAGPQ